jgi:hypothetical protein
MTVLTRISLGIMLFMMKLLNNRMSRGLLAGLLLVATPVITQAFEGVIEYLDGEVVVERRGSEFDAEFGMAVTSGDAVRTGEDGVAIVRLNDRSQVKLRENTRIRIDSVSQEAAVTLDTGGLFARVARQTVGAARIISGFEVRTPTAVAGVRGTEFFVAYGRTIEDAPDIWLCVNEGAVDVVVPSTGDSTLVEEGEGINILAGLRTTEPRFYPWTRELNWNFDAGSGDVVDKTDLDGAYADLLDQDYD